PAEPRIRAAAAGRAARPSLLAAQCIAGGPRPHPSTARPASQHLQRSPLRRPRPDLAADAAAVSGPAASSRLAAGIAAPRVALDLPHRTGPLKVGIRLMRRLGTAGAVFGLLLLLLAAWYLSAAAGGRGQGCARY